MRGNFLYGQYCVGVVRSYRIEWCISFFNCFVTHLLELNVFYQAFDHGYLFRFYYLATLY